MSYSKYNNDTLDPARKIQIEHNIYLKGDRADISALALLPLEQLKNMREESAAAEKQIFHQMQQQAIAWEEQAGKTLLFDKAIEYANTSEVQHTANQWDQLDEYRHIKSNMVYQMYYKISEDTRYDMGTKQFIPHSWTLEWNVRTNGPDRLRQAKIAGQDRKTFADKADMEKYLNGRIKAYQHLFTEISPPIPPEYAQYFKVNGLLLPGYTIEGEAQEQEKPVINKLMHEEQQGISSTVQAGLQTLNDTNIKVIEAPQTEPRPVSPITLTSQKPAEKVKEITEHLEQGIKELFDSERYKEYLRVMSKFHAYSLNNTLLIAMQKPDASLVAGLSSWNNNFGRKIIKGQKGIKIIAPSPFKTTQEVEKIEPDTGKPVIGKDGKPVTEEKEITIPSYRVVSVFDVSQTEGKELPTIAVDKLTGSVENYKDFFAALEKTSPVPVGFEQIAGKSHGYYNLKDKRIAIQEGMGELQTLKTAVHEIAHAKLHDIDLNAPKDEQQPRIDRYTREVQAESVAYTVCQHYGLDTSEYSFGYIAGWSSGRELPELKSSLETIRNTAVELIDTIDGHLAEIQRERENEIATGNQRTAKALQELADQEQEKYTYYSLHRPVSPGTYPKDGLVNFENFDRQSMIDSIGREAWAVLHYDRELTEREIRDYEFAREPQITPVRKPFDLEFTTIGNGITVWNHAAPIYGGQESKKSDVKDYETIAHISPDGMHVTYYVDKDTLPENVMQSISQAAQNQADTYNEAQMQAQEETPQKQVTCDEIVGQYVRGQEIAGEIAAHQDSLAIKLQDSESIKESNRVAPDLNTDCAYIKNGEIVADKISLEEAATRLLIDSVAEKQGMYQVVANVSSASRIPLLDGNDRGVEMPVSDISKAINLEVNTGFREHLAEVANKADAIRIKDPDNKLGLKPDYCADHDIKDKDTEFADSEVNYLSRDDAEECLEA